MDHGLDIGPQLYKSDCRVGPGILFGKSAQTGKLRPFLAKEFEIERFHDHSIHARVLSKARANFQVNRYFFIQFEKV